MAATPVSVTQSSVFARAYKKLHLQQKQAVNSAVELIVSDPLAGEAKRGDLAGVYVYKFKSQSQLVLLAYEFDPKTRHLLLIGSHENFYRELKR
ncbi:MAG: type II toxin-antitoxin system RelE/ParE family toxin [Actinobacteria bacterium]|nr:type II toxin-antitoxin system RelE/ParE family toxin [Actinomycetota bacterium]